MSIFNVLEAINQMIEKGDELNIDLSEVKQKIQDVIKRLDNQNVHVVIAGATSDGKTTVIAGMYEQLFNDMNIAVQESSDDLAFYRPKGMKEGYEIVDTPGLFGEKEKIVNGKQTRFSEITEKYISEAHILIYVCSATNPIKESHKEDLCHILKTFNKLDSTIFVINRMDETDCDLTDEEDFKAVSDIKKASFIKRLKETIDLTPEEEKNLKIVCIAADPGAEGMNHWLEHKEDYNRRSHINGLRENFNQLIAERDVSFLKESANEAVVMEIIKGIQQEAEKELKSVKSSLKRSEETKNELQKDLKMMQKELIKVKGDMNDKLKELRLKTLRDLNNAPTGEDLYTVVEENLGYEGTNKISCHILKHDIIQILHEGMCDNEGVLHNRQKLFERKISEHNIVMDKIFKKGHEMLRSTTIDNKMVLEIRDFAFKDHKFNPWGATKIADKLNKGMVALDVAFEILDCWRLSQEKSELKKAKEDIKEYVEGMFKTIFDDLDNNEVYFRTYVPFYAKLETTVDKVNKDYILTQTHEKNLEEYNAKVKKFLFEDVINVDFE